MKSPSLDDLVGRDYEQCDCWALAREALGRFGVELPVDPAMALAGLEALGSVLDRRVATQGGDVLIMREPDGTRQHVGVAVDAFRFLHSTRPTSRIERIAVYQRAGRIRLRVRPRAMCPPPPLPEVRP